MGYADVTRGVLRYMTNTSMLRVAWESNQEAHSRETRMEKDKRAYKGEGRRRKIKIYEHIVGRKQIKTEEVRERIQLFRKCLLE